MVNDSTNRILEERQVKDYVIAALHLNTQDRDELFELQQDNTTSSQIKKQFTKYELEYLRSL